MLTALSIFIILYLSTYQQSTIILFPAILLIAGIVMQIYFMQKLEYVDSIIEQSQNIAFYTLMALAVIAVGSIIVPAIANLPQLSKMEITGMDAILYSILIAIAEEQFFRGALTNLLLMFSRSEFASIIASAAVFSVYHLAVYKTDWTAISFVFVGGIALAWVSVRSGRLSPAMLAHVINNVLSFMLR
jgi:membrane protease YdiL (CAAX protease family)